MTQSRATPQIGFLYNHDAAHQIAHSAGVMREYALAHPGHRVTALYGVKSMEPQIREMVGPVAAERIEWFHLGLSAAKEALLAPFNRIAPVYRIARLRDHLTKFAECDVIVSTERTCLWIKRKLGKSSPKFIFIPHGAGDRNVSYHPALSQFDRMLVSGEKVADEMVRNAILPRDAIDITGYPKFDMVDFNSNDRIFSDEKPVFLYNPHFDPVLSSWYDHGLQLIDAFARDPSLGNLIVAPHVMLFRKKIHYSPEFKKIRIRPDMPGGASQAFIAPNIYVDTGSQRLFDMSYTLAVDAYIGDASSQVYEFLIRPRPCYFLDCRGLHREGDVQPPADSLFWDAGRIFHTVDALVAALPFREQDQKQFRVRQIELFKMTMDEPVLGTKGGFDETRLPACYRAAQALSHYIDALAL